MPEEFCNETFSHSAHQTWLYMLKLYPAKQATISERAKHEVLAEL